MEVSTTSTTDPVNMYNYLNNYILNPIVFIIILLIIVSYYVFSTSLDSNSSGLGNEDNTSNIMVTVIVAILLVLIIVNAFQYFFSINITAYIHDLFTPNAKIDIVVDQSTYQPTTVPEIKFKKQVFNIPGNYYSYENAKAVCKAYDADLASYDQLEKAYNSGAEWCNYGWSDGQMALFPTQQKTFDDLQKIEGHENDCGRPGVNGGYMKNPALKFGVNCYGYKPKMTTEEEDLMATQPIYPKTAKDIAMENRVNYWKDKLTEVLVSPFNHNTWSKL